MSLKKQVLKSKPVTKVTFRISKEMACDAGSVSVVGDFNNWDIIATPMSPLKNGEYSAIVELDQNNTYAFRYYIDGEWYNEPEADGQAANEFGSENSLVIV
ncbi:MAG: isoamylase early set domain-containing protein [Mangrovibacterium sp.]